MTTDNPAIIAELQGRRALNPNSIFYTTQN